MQYQFDGEFHGLSRVTGPTHNRHLAREIVRRAAVEARTA